MALPTATDLDFSARHVCVRRDEAAAEHAPTGQVIVFPRVSVIDLRRIAQTMQSGGEQQ